MSESDHRFIIKYHDSFFYGLNNYTIVMEYCEVFKPLLFIIIRMKKNEIKS